MLSSKIFMQDFLEGRLDTHERLLWSQHHINKGFTGFVVATNWYRQHHNIPDLILMTSIVFFSAREVAKGLCWEICHWG